MPFTSLDTSVLTPSAGTLNRSIVVKHLRKTKEADVGVAVMYCNYKERDVQSPVNLMASLWRQLVLDHPISSMVKDLHRRHDETGTQPSLDEVVEVLRSVIQTFSEVFVVVDGLDECPEDDNIRQTLLISLQEVQPTTHLMFTSRPHVNIVTDFPESVTLNIRASDDDVENYLDGRMKERGLAKLLRGHIELQNDIRTTILDISDGMCVLSRYISAQCD